jgi:Na+-transporting NADH:ubiquinone oxidoreductase subunit NqrC
MAVDKNTTSYTVGFAVILVVVCGVLLASLASSLKDRQKKMWPTKSGSSFYLPQVMLL